MSEEPKEDRTPEQWDMYDLNGRPGNIVVVLDFDRDDNLVSFGCSDGLVHLDYNHFIRDYTFSNNALRCLNACADLGDNPANEIKNLQTIRGYFVEAQDSLLIDDSNCSSEEWMEEVRKRIKELLEAEKEFKALKSSRLDVIGERHVVVGHRRILGLEVTKQAYTGLVWALRELAAEWATPGMGAKSHLTSLKLKSILAAHPAAKPITDAGKKIKRAPTCDKCGDKFDGSPFLCEMCMPDHSGDASDLVSAGPLRELVARLSKNFKGDDDYSLGIKVAKNLFGKILSEHGVEKPPAPSQPPSPEPSPSDPLG